MNTRTNFALTIAAAAITAAALFFALPSSSSPAAALTQTADTPTPSPTPEQIDDSGVQNLPPLDGKINPPKYRNMDSVLNKAVENYKRGKRSAVSVQNAASSAHKRRAASVAVTFYTDAERTQSVADFLESSGASPRNIGIDYVEAYIPISLLAEASQQEGVISVRTIIPPQPAQGAVVGEGAAAHGADAWNAAGYRGKGVKIGVIDVGFEGFRKLMGSELPATVKARCYIEVGVFTKKIEDCTDSEDHEIARKHGTAVTEAIFDIAPDAAYYIANTHSKGDMLDAVKWMASKNVDVINHSMGWEFDGPGDGTSIYSDSPLRAVDAAVSGGITWINAAGNSAKETWTGAFKDVGADGWHNFTEEDECAGITIKLKPRQEFFAELRWDDAWGGANSDLDLYLNRIGVPAAVASSEDEQAGAADDIPYESISFDYGIHPNGAYCLSIRHQSGTAPARIQLQVWEVRGELQHYISASSIANPAESANPGMLAVGAARWSRASAIESFSSRGPTTDGRTKPDIVGADGGRSATYGRWYGTSQASPNVAGLAALVKQRFPEYTPQQVAQYLKTHADPR